MLSEKTQLPQLCPPSLTGSDACTASRQEEVSENVFGALLGKFSVHLRQPMTPCSWSTDRAVRMEGNQSCCSLRQLQCNAGLK